MIYYSLNKPIASDKIISDIQKLLSQYNNNLKDHALVISLKKIVDYEDSPTVRNITYHEDCST